MNLGFKVNGDPMNKQTGDASVVILDQRDSILKRLSLGYYVNQVADSFAHESMIVHAIFLSQLEQGDLVAPVHKSHLLKNFKIIKQILYNEFILFDEESQVVRENNLFP